MATIQPCREHVPGYTPGEVFEVGTLVDTLPHLDGFILETDSERFAKGVVVNIGLTLAKFDFRIEGKVTECEYGKRVKIQGASHVGRAALWLDLLHNEDLEGTDIQYGLQIKHSLSTKLAEPLVASHLRATMPQYAAMFKDNVLQRLDDLRAAS